MSYNIDQLPRYINTAGKITIVTSLLGVVVFALVFLLNIGVKELNQVSAQSSGLATTTVTVLNTPPQWTVDAQEVSESSTSTPTNSGDIVSWHATATDSNAEDYYLLICSGTSTPTEPQANPGGAPSCANGQTQWAVSAAASSSDVAVAATTTTEAAPFAESNAWFAWVCDSVTNNPRCNSTYKQGTGNTASPFNVNKRPTFTGFTDNSPGLPGATITFTATADDPDIDPTDDNVRLWVCSTPSFNATSSIGCNADTMASSTLSLNNPTATYQIPTPMPDGTYGAYGYIIDNHDHVATGIYQGTSSVLTVLNATPTVAAGTIYLNDGNNLILTGNATQTTGYTLQFTVQDDNSCDANEIADYRVSVYRSSIGSSTCDGITGANYDANNCYTSGVPTTTWNVSCTASSTSCTYGVDGLDDEEVWDCTFPLWFVADPTNGASASSSYYFADDWRAGVTAIDDNGATSTYHTQSSTAGIDLLSFLYFSLDTTAIPYGSLEPGTYSSPTISASTTIRSEGNIGLDERLAGTPMCETSVFNSSTTCPNSATSTVPDYEQVFATSTVTYGVASTSGNTLSSTTQKLLDLNVLKPTSTASTTSGVTYWGINIPSSITLAGSYEGENTFYGVASHGNQWY